MQGEFQFIWDGWTIARCAVSLCFSAKEINLGYFSEEGTCCWKNNKIWMLLTVKQLKRTLALNRLSEAAVYLATSESAGPWPGFSLK
jgi:hypothetical protein